MPIYYRGAAAAIVVYDITDGQSFKDMKHWIDQLQKLAPYGIVLTLVGNKCDMEGQRQVSVETSVETISDGGLHQLFFMMCRSLMKRDKSMLRRLEPRSLKQVPRKGPIFNSCLPV